MNAGMSLLNLLSRLPIGFLYFLSDLLLYPAMRWIPGYRKGIVRKNIGLAFPKATSGERRSIERGFYRHLGNFLVETLKMPRLDDKEIDMRMKWQIAERLKEDAARRPVVCYCSHYCNWEWLIMTLPRAAECNVYIIYSTLHNRAANDWILRQRARLGTHVVAMDQAGGLIRSLKECGKGGIVIAIADQLPKEQYVRHFSRLLGIKSKVITGTESLIKRENLPTYIHRMIKTDRGRYKNIIEPLEGYGEGEWPITDAYISRLDAQLRERPELWLWSHDRWHR